MKKDGCECRDHRRHQQADNQGYECLFRRSSSLPILSQGHIHSVLNRAQKQAGAPRAARAPRRARFWHRFPVDRGHVREEKEEDQGLGQQQVSQEGPVRMHRAPSTKPGKQESTSAVHQKYHPTRREE